VFSDLHHTHIKTKTNISVIASTRKPKKKNTKQQEKVDEKLTNFLNRCWKLLGNQIKCCWSQLLVVTRDWWDEQQLLLKIQLQDTSTSTATDTVDTLMYSITVNAAIEWKKCVCCLSVSVWSYLFSSKVINYLQFLSNQLLFLMFLLLFSGKVTLRLCT